VRTPKCGSMANWLRRRRCSFSLMRASANSACSTFLMPDFSPLCRTTGLWVWRPIGLSSGCPAPTGTKAARPHSTPYQTPAGTTAARRPHVCRRPAVRRRWRLKVRASFEQRWTEHQRSDRRQRSTPRHHCGGARCDRFIGDGSLDRWVRLDRET